VCVCVCVCVWCLSIYTHVHTCLSLHILRFIQMKQQFKMSICTHVHTCISLHMLKFTHMKQHFKMSIYTTQTYLKVVFHWCEYLIGPLQILIFIDPYIFWYLHKYTLTYWILEHTYFDIGINEIPLVTIFIHLHTWRTSSWRFVCLNITTFFMWKSEHVYFVISINETPLVTIFIYIHTWRTGWRRLIGSPKLQIIFHKRATECRALLRKMTHKDKASYGSSPPCTSKWRFVHVNIATFLWILEHVYFDIHINETPPVTIFIYLHQCTSSWRFVYLNTTTFLMWISERVYFDIYINETPF